MGIWRRHRVTPQMMADDEEERREAAETRKQSHRKRLDYLGQGLPNTLSRFGTEKEV